MKMTQLRKLQYMQQSLEKERAMRKVSRSFRIQLLERCDQEANQLLAVGREGLIRIAIGDETGLVQQFKPIQRFTCFFKRDDLFGNENDKFRTSYLLPLTSYLSSGLRLEVIGNRRWSYN